MKILFYIHAITGGGAERVLVTLANEFSHKGEEVYVATNTMMDFAFHIDEGVNLINLYRNTSVESCNLTKRLISALRLRQNIRSIANEVRPDVIVAFTSALSCSVIASTFGLGIPVIVSEHTNVSRNLGKILNLKRNILYPFADAITILTRYDKNVWKNKFRNLVYMPNPVNFNEVNSEQSNREKVVLAVGRVNQWQVKGFDNLLKCWSKLCNEFPDWKLQILGYGDKISFDKLINLANFLQCSNYEFLGFKQNVNEIMCHSEVFCLSSRVEGLPMALIEAMNAGCCCVSFDVLTGPREIIQNNKSGLLALNQNNEDLTEKLRLVMNDENLRKKLAYNAPHSIKKFSLENIIKRWYILFDKVLNK